MIRLAAALALLCLPFFAQSQKLVRQKIDDKLSIAVPDGYKRLTPDQAQQRALTPKPPLAVFTDPTGEFEVALNASNAFFDAADVPMMQSFYKANLRGLYNKINFIHEGIETVGGKKAVVFEFTSEVTEKGRPPIRKYTLVHYTLRVRRVIVSSASCDQKQMQRYQKTAHEILDTER